MIIRAARRWRSGGPMALCCCLVDPEHDQFIWVGPDDAYARCRPQVVADGLRRALATRVHDIAFRPMVRGDLAAMKSWLHAPHVARWWHRIPEDLAALEAKYKAGFQPSGTFANEDGDHALYVLDRRREVDDASPLA